MLVQLQAFDSECSFSVEVIDVDGDEALVAQFDELVPVLFGARDNGEFQQLCHYFLDIPVLKAFLHA
jgi:hypothetical protein